jgi:EAL domain-containing protein (putative c-di-GMP-specific phosphodiesterase class I)/GGDEF domain-containing protein
MKRYTWKLAIAFLISYVLLMVVVVFTYTQITSNFIHRQASNHILSSSEVVTKRVDAQLKLDYQRFKDLIDYLNQLSIDPIPYLYANIEEITVLDFNFTGFGELNQRILTIQGEPYTYTTDFELDDFDQRINIYTFNQAFGTQDDTTYIFIKYQSYVAFFEAEPYLNQLLSISTLLKHYALMGSDNQIYYRSFEEGQSSFFYQYLRDQNVSETSIDRIKLFVSSGNQGIAEHKFLGTQSFITFNPLSTEHSLKNLYLVQVFIEMDVLNSMSYLTNILWALFFVIFVLFAGAMVLLFKILESKVNDIENARITHYYAKPYIVRITAKGKIKSYNQSFRKLLGDYDIYDDVKDFNIKKDFDLEFIEDVIRRQRAFTALFELGLSRIVYIRFVPIRTTGGYLLIGDDITNIEGRFDEYRNLALFNKVTHMPNYNSLKQDLSVFFQDKELLEKKNVLLAVDVVSFSRINLLLGEKSADRFLIIVSELLDESLEGYPATVYNTVADSFVVFFKDIENENWVNRWITKITSIFEKPVTIDKNFINIDLRIGIFIIEPGRYEILNADIAYDNMMLALNHAKESATHKFFFYDVSLSLIASREQRMEADLANAIKNQEFYMALQPQFDNSSERIIGFEALIRWNNPKYASESPLKFIQMAEKNNMIIDIGRIALHETFQIAKEFEKYNVHISLNISPVQILQAGFVNEIISVFEQYELKKHSVSLEITETFLIGSFDLVINKLKILQKYGFDIHLDDFGTGYSSLQYLKDLPISTIKIDRAFIIDLETDAHSKAIVTMISSLAKNVGLEVVAEGIENDRQNLIAYKSGCNIIQGYLVSRPVPKSDAIRLIEDYNINKTKSLNLMKQIKAKEIKR